MASKNDDGGAAMGLGLLAAGVFIMAMVVYAIVCFISLVFTVLSLLALTLNRPIPIGGGYAVTPDEGRIFLISGLIGAVGVPFFALMCAWLFNSRVDPFWWFYLVTGGYSVVSIGVAAYLAENEPAASPQTFKTIEHSAPAPAVPAPAQPFRFATWDDGEKRG
ncbi:MAG: hypothetical protein ACTHKQ_02195 [Mesorhizobium sp.]